MKHVTMFWCCLLMAACHGPATPTKPTVRQGSWVTFHYRLTLANGTRVDESRCNSICPQYPTVPLKVKAGRGWLVPAWDAALWGMQAGETKTVTILPEQGWGKHPPQGLSATDTLLLTVTVTQIQPPAN